MTDPQRQLTSQRRAWGPRRRAAIATLVIGTGVLLGAAGLAAAQGSMTKDAAPDEQPSADETGRTRMDPADLPADAFEPQQAGDGTVASFARFLASTGDDAAIAPRPRATTAEAMAARASTVAAGTISSVELVQGTMHLGSLEAATIDLVIELTPSAETLKGATSANPQRWRINLWMGDPMLADRFAHRFETELGDGPVGARAALCGDPSPADGTPRVHDGVIEDGSGSAHLSRPWDGADGDANDDHPISVEDLRTAIDP